MAERAFGAARHRGVAVQVGEVVAAPAADELVTGTVVVGANNAGFATAFGAGHESGVGFGFGNGVAGLGAAAGRAVVGLFIVVNAVFLQAGVAAGFADGRVLSVNGGGHTGIVRGRGSGRATFCFGKRGLCRDIIQAMKSTNAPPRIGVLALQGGFDAHIASVNAAGGDAVAVRSAEEIAGCDGLILPGGESTTIGRMMTRYGLDTAIRAAHTEGMPIYGTCAGMILLAKQIDGGEKQGGQPTLGLMDIHVVRNAFGRQTESFETDIAVPSTVAGSDGEAGFVRGVFIRAPYVSDAGAAVQVLAQFDGKTVLVRENNLLASAFHPELTGDVRLHRYFLRMVSGTS